MEKLTEEMAILREWIADGRDAKLQEAREQLGQCFGEEPTEVHGKLSELFLRAERTGATVYWGCWTQSELEVEL